MGSMDIMHRVSQRERTLRRPILHSLVSCTCRIPHLLSLSHCFPTPSPSTPRPLDGMLQISNVRGVGAARAQIASSPHLIHLAPADTETRRDPFPTPTLHTRPIIVANLGAALLVWTDEFTGDLARGEDGFHPCQLGDQYIFFVPCTACSAHCNRAVPGVIDWNLD